ncbi:hypothetical protein PTTG_29082 [Puccinia triticina 1-1 BBBD Race 1]|uniref:MHD domain-containing protein n=1 Tax=Puccinia triticina (isolate 1-1 / race 1 (BBBD)) TaxID=630390 RepID=A0A180G6H5_PUCT1|nr:hypothetical protein PTTG_29082 [Puccinia triticina 1-1 BBBD Race 1]
MADSVGLLLLASNGTLLLRSSTALQLTNIPTPIPPIIHLPPASPLGPASASAASESESESDPGEHTHPQHSLCCCNLIKHQLWLACITRADIEPAIVFEYLNRFYSLLSTYLTTNNQLNPTQIEANFDLVHQLIHLTAPTNESPYGKNWADPALIHEIIPTKSKSLVKFISEATETLSKGKSHHQPKPTIFSSTIPWRPTGLEYPKQEIWLDLIESISAIVDPDGHILSFELVGIVDIQSRLSGLPDISLKFSDPTKIDRVGFHSCVRYSRWEKEKLVSFVPPDGRFRLMSYRSTPSSASLPVTIRPTVTLGEQGGSFILLISCHASVARLVIRWQLGRLATGVVSDQLLCRARDGRRIEPVWEWEEARKQIRCTFEGIDTNCCLSGLWTHRSKENEPSHAIQVDFESKSESPNLSFQGLKVDKLDIKPHPSFPDHHHQPFSHHHQQTRAGLAALAAPFGTRTAVSKGVKMKFRSAQYEVRW